MRQSGVVQISNELWDIIHDGCTDFPVSGQEDTSRLAQVMGLPGRINQVMNDYFPASRWKSIYWKKCIEKIFISQGLNDGWHSFIGHIDAPALSELGLLFMSFETIGSHAEIASEEITVILTKITELRN